MPDTTVFLQEVSQIVFRDCGFEDLDDGQQVRAVLAFAFHGAVPFEPGFDEVVYFGRMGHELDFADEVGGCSPVHSAGPVTKVYYSTCSNCFLGFASAGGESHKYPPTRDPTYF